MNTVSPLIPAIVWCCHQLLVAVQLPDGQIAVTLQSLCKALNLNRPGQLTLPDDLRRASDHRGSRADA